MRALHSSAWTRAAFGSKVANFGHGHLCERYAPRDQISWRDPNETLAGFAWQPLVGIQTMCSPSCNAQGSPWSRRPSVWLQDRHGFCRPLDSPIRSPLPVSCFNQRSSQLLWRPMPWAELLTMQVCLPAPSFEWRCFLSLPCGLNQI